ncbi:unnamed protein product [Camellia sinensis]
MDNMAPRFRHEELPETWYTQFFEKYEVTKPYRLSFGDRERDKRTPELMSTYLRILEKHKRRRVAFKEDETNHALPHINRVEEDHKVDFNGVLDMLAQITTRSPIMIERLGIRPEYQMWGLNGSLVSRGIAELVSDSTRNPVQQTHQQMQVIQSQTESQQQAPLRQPQQVYSSKMMKMIALGVVTLQMPRQMRPQMQQMVHPQNLAFQQQQQWKSMRQRQPSTSRPGMDNIKPLVEVKLENPAEFPIDSNALTAINARHHPQLQFRQQQIAAMSNFHPEASNQFRQLASLQIPQVQTQSMGTVRAPPVKVEGFQELMGGDATLKHDSEENKSTSPPK